MRIPVAIATRLPIRQSRLLLILTAVAFVPRLIVGLHRGPDWINTGYTLNIDIAQNWWRGHGLCAAEGAVECAVRLPVYPLLIAPFVNTGSEYPLLLILQALIGAGLAPLTFALAMELFNGRVALLAAVAAALDPYAVIHSTALQDTVVVDSLAVLAVLLTLVAYRRADLRLVVAAGVAASLLILTSARIAPFVMLTIGWTMVYPATTRVRTVLVMLLPVALLVGPWLVRNYYVVGGPVLTTETGLSLWKGHNEIAMTVYPERTLDEIDDLLWARLTPEQRKRVEEAPTELTADRELGRIGLAYIRTRPLESLRNAVLRVWHGFVGGLMPYRSWPIQLGYAVIFTPVTVLALLGLWRAGTTAPHILMRLAFASLIFTSAVFWTYTSHRSYLHAFEFIYAASVLELWSRRFRRVPAS